MYGDPVQVNAAVEKETVYVGEPFLFQVQVDGSNHAEEPDMSQLTGFTVQYQGGQQNNSTSISIINGHMSKVVHRGFIFSYRLTAIREGTLTIPPVTVMVDGKQYETNPVVIRARKPRETRDFKLRQRLSKTECAVGEPVVLTITWYIARPVRNPVFTIPVLDDDRFQVMEYDGPVPRGRNAVQVTVARASGKQETVTAEQGQGSLNGMSYVTVTFHETLVPLKEGTFHLPEATVSFQVQTRRRSRSLFDSFFPDDFFGSQVSFQNMVIPSLPMQLYVAPLPDEGKPADFTGLVGTFELSAQASPSDVNVGDPITLTITVRGPMSLQMVQSDMFALSRQLGKDFKVPEEMAPGEVKTDPKTGKPVKVFTQTIRALRDDVKAVPPISLNYYDPGTHTYREARTKPIPLTVHPTRQVTAEDAEGKAPIVATHNVLTTRKGGIAHNYAGPAVITPQVTGLAVWRQSRLWQAMTLFPPLVYGLLLLGIWAGRFRKARSGQVAARRAYRALVATGKRLRGGEQTPDAWRTLSDALTAYLRLKLGLASGAATFADFREALEQRGIAGEKLNTLRHILETCEAFQYAGGQGRTDDLASVCEQALAFARTVEKEVRS